VVPRGAHYSYCVPLGPPSKCSEIFKHEDVEEKRKTDIEQDDVLVACRSLPFSDAALRRFYRHKCINLSQMRRNSRLFDPNHHGYRFIRDLRIISGLGEDGDSPDLDELAVSTARRGEADDIVDTAVELLARDTLQSLCMPNNWICSAESLYSLFANQHNLREFKLGALPERIDITKLFPSAWMNGLRLLVIPRFIGGSNDARFYGEILANLATLPNLIILTCRVFGSGFGLMDLESFIDNMGQHHGDGSVFREMLSAFNSLSTSNPGQTRVNNLLLYHVGFSEVYDILPVVVDLSSIQILDIRTSPGAAKLLQNLTPPLGIHAPCSRMLRSLTLIGQLDDSTIPRIDDMLKQLPLLECFHRETNWTSAPGTWERIEKPSWTCTKLKHFGLRQGSLLGTGSLALEDSEQLSRIITKMPELEQLAIAIQIPEFSGAFDACVSFSNGAFGPLVIGADPGPAERFSAYLFEMLARLKDDIL
jgi:hypothetical protein